MKIQTALKIDIDEADLRAAVVKMIAEHNPNIVVDDIQFIQRRNPSRIDVEVAAHIAGMQDAEPMADTTPIVDTEVLGKVTDDNVPFNSEPEDKDALINDADPAAIFEDEEEQVEEETPVDGDIATIFG